MHIVRHLCVEPGAGYGQGKTAIAVNGVQQEPGAVPQVLRVVKQGGHIPKILQKIVARPQRHAGHGGIVRTSVAAAGVEAQRLSGLRQLPDRGGSVARALGQDAVHVQAVASRQPLGHCHYAGRAVPLSGSGVDDKDMFHSIAPFSAR